MLRRPGARHATALEPCEAACAPELGDRYPPLRQISQRDSRRSGRIAVYAKTNRALTLAHRLGPCGNPMEPHVLPLSG